MPDTKILSISTARLLKKIKKWRGAVVNERVVDYQYKIGRCQVWQYQLNQVK